MVGDSIKAKPKTAAVKSPPSQTKKANSDSPISVDFSKKTLRLNLFGNTLDIDFRKRNLEVNKDQKNPAEDL